MADIEELVKIEITKPLPETGTIGETYKIEGTVKMFDAVGALPWVYAEVRRKEWWKPEIIEEVSYERGFPMPVSGTFSIDISPEKKSDYEVTLIATPAPLSLPVVGVFPVVGKSDMVKIRVAEEIATDIKNIEISVLGPAFPATDIKNIMIDVIGPAFPSTDIKNIAIIVRGPEFPSTDLKNIIIKPIGVAFPSTDIKNIEISVVPIAPPEEYTLEVTVEPPASGHVLVSPRKATYSAGEVVTLTASPYSGYEFDHWGGWPPYPDVGSTSPTLELTMTDNWWVVAAFREVAPPQFTLEVTIEPPATGYVTKSPSKAKYSAGEVVTLTAHPYSGYEFDHWGGWPPYPGVGSTSPTLELTMDADWWVVAIFREVAPVTTVTVALKNPPSGANKWQMRIVDDVGLKTLMWGADARDNIEEVAVFELSPEWLFPLMVDISIYEEWQENGEWHARQLYRAQSIRPYLWDFDKGDWGDEEDPDYREVFIPEYGSYYYNVATERFEKI